MIREKHKLSRIRNCHWSMCPSLETVWVFTLKLFELSDKENVKAVLPQTGPPNLVVWLAFGKSRIGESVTPRLHRHTFTDCTAHSRTVQWLL